MQAPQFAPQTASLRHRDAAEARDGGLGIVVFSSDSEVIDTVQQAVRGRLPVYNAGNVVHVVKILTEHRPGVLVTDVSEDKATIQSMTARLKEHLPELVTIAVSQHRDVLDMVWLINHGQIFRFLRKPLSAGRCAISLQAALQHHRMLSQEPRAREAPRSGRDTRDHGRRRRRRAREAQEHQTPLGISHDANAKTRADKATCFSA